MGRIIQRGEEKKRKQLKKKEKEDVDISRIWKIAIYCDLQ